MSEPAGDADPLAQTLGKHLAAVGVHELILQGRAACVDDQNLHFGSTPIKCIYSTGKIK